MMSLAAGCTSADPEPTETPSARADALVASVDASANARAKAGIAKWNFYKSAEGLEHADGVGADGKVITTVAVRVGRERVVVDGAEKELIVRTMTSSSGGLLRITETGTMLENRPDELGLSVFANDMVTLDIAKDKLALYDCNGVSWAICGAYCYACASGGWGFCSDCGSCVGYCVS